MDLQDLQDTLDAHRKWLARGSEGERADLHGVDLHGADLRDRCLRHAKLDYAELSDANLGGANLRRTNLTHANLICANLSGADLTSADLRRADLRDADLRNANLKNTDLSGTWGLVSVGDYLEENFEFDASGMLCYKVFGVLYDVPERWTIEEGSVIRENVNPHRTLDCACGVNVATRQWMRGYNFPSREIWRCRIAWPDLAGVVVPYDPDGKIRAERVRLLEKADL
jgi:hypothetical protein